MLLQNLLLDRNFFSKNCILKKVFSMRVDREFADMYT
ncbi:hypothetical protein Pla123a_25080 [Posidoniimonas polymericola]|uniref:Uncharacterized protein n=1 Tax=Posidoniimonas polymericola TaxID=2528002 RepID=A0A5C5YQK0_9BACT|nr:hypothetical protein Pla123a_25080 [Posidoniimonas polymericola]